MDPLYIQLARLLLTSERGIGLPALAAAGDVIAAEARFSIWHAGGGVGASRLPGDAYQKFVRVAELAELPFEACVSAIGKYKTDGNAGALASALEGAAKGFAELMNDPEKVAAQHPDSGLGSRPWRSR